jgi:hypothetical protein
MFFLLKNTIVIVTATDLTNNTISPNMRENINWNSRNRYRWRQRTLLDRQGRGSDCSGRQNFCSMWLKIGRQAIWECRKNCNSRNNNTVSIQTYFVPAFPTDEPIYRDCLDLLLPPFSFSRAVPSPL